MVEINYFQKKCKDELMGKLKSLGINISDLRIKESERKWFAEKEVFIEATVDNLKIWIYEDGAYIKGLNINVPFEAPDYNTEEDLISAFVNKVIFFLK